MGHIQKAGSYFYKVANILLLAIIINIFFFIALERMAHKINEAFPTNTKSAFGFESEAESQYINEITNKQAKEKSYTIIVLICSNLILIISMINNLYNAANCLINYDIKRKVEE